MCVFGTSGAGKSFYIKLLILRYRLLGLEQYVIDPDREYSKLCKELKEIESLTLEVNEDNIIAQNLYKKFGFEILGKRKNYYKDRAAVIMTLYF